MEYAIVLAVIPLGLLVGLVPALGASVALTLLYALISSLPFNTLIAFYAVFITATQFSGSVVALWLGVPGEVSSTPVVKERDAIIGRGQLMLALKRTAVGSGVGVLTGLALLGVLLYSDMHFAAFFRTELMAVLLVGMLVGSVVWPSNAIVVNVMLVLVGLVVGNVGYGTVYAADTFMTWGQPWLYGGLPFFPVLLGIYAVPALLDLPRLSGASPGLAASATATSSPPDPLAGPIARGSVVGFALGLVPLIGTISSSNVAHWLESRRRLSTPLSRVTAAESANNAACISVLAPLLLYGIAIQPSEAIVLSILQDRAWTTANVTGETLLIGAVSLAVAVVVCYIACWHFAKTLVYALVHHYNVVITTVTVALVCNVWWLGTQQAMGLYYLITFLLASTVGGLLKWRKIDPLPLVFMWLVGEHLGITLVRAYSLYF